jgi:hypothetical protein
LIQINASDFLVRYTWRGDAIGLSASRRQHQLHARFNAASETPLTMN